MAQDLEAIFERLELSPAGRTLMEAITAVRSSNALLDEARQELTMLAGMSDSEETTPTMFELDRLYTGSADPSRLRLHFLTACLDDATYERLKSIEKMYGHILSLDEDDDDRVMEERTVYREEIGSYETIDDRLILRPLHSDITYNISSRELSTLSETSGIRNYDSARMKDARGEWQVEPNPEKGTLRVSFFTDDDTAQWPAVQLHTRETLLTSADVQKYENSLHVLYENLDFSEELFIVTVWPGEKGQGEGEPGEDADR